MKGLFKSLCGFRIGLNMFLTIFLCGTVIGCAKDGTIGVLAMIAAVSLIVSALCNRKRKDK